jgi:hypothetical protein
VLLSMSLTPVLSLPCFLLTLRSCKRWFVLLSLGPLEVPTLVDSLTPSHLTWMARQGTLGPQTLCCGVPGGWQAGPGTLAVCGAVRFAFP